jgi:hypothetical protein
MHTPASPYLPAALALAASAILLGPASCQDLSIVGWVTDKSNDQPIYMAWLDLVGPEHAKGVTNGMGYWARADLPPGVYTVSIAHPGYKAMSKTVRLKRGDVPALNFELEPGEGGTAEIAVRSECWRLVGEGKLTDLKQPVKTGEATLKWSATLSPRVKEEPAIVYGGESGRFRRITMWCRPLNVPKLRVVVSDKDGTEAEWNLGPEALKGDWSKVVLDRRAAKVTKRGEDGVLGEVVLLSFRTGDPSGYPRAGTCAWYFNDIKAEY